MKQFLKIGAAMLTVAALLCSALLSTLAATEKTYYDYGKYVLLGDSVASGYSDIEDYETEFVRVDDSYGAYIADDLGLEYIPMACPAFRTVEMRYIFEDDFEGDRFLFYLADDEEVMKSRIPEIRKAVSEAGLITLGIGGNDWGTYLGWHVDEEMEKFEDANEEFLELAEDYLMNAGVEDDVIGDLIDLAAFTDSLPQLLKILPKALETGINNFFNNWDKMIEDIYALNPDVTLVVVGMFDNSVKSAEDAEEKENALLKLSIGQMIVDIANIPMIEGAEKYGYIYVDTSGTVCVESHPTPEGHRHIADLILEALPDASFPYTDIDQSHKNYKAVEYVYQQELMCGTGLTEFSPDIAARGTELSAAVNTLVGKNILELGDGEITRLAAAKALLECTGEKEGSFNQSVKTLLLAVKIIINGGKLNASAPLTRAEAAQLISDYSEIL